MISLKDYYDLLDAHDWYYEWSDDTGVWRVGRAEEIKLLAMAGQSEEHKKLYEAFAKHMFTGCAFGNDRVPLPKRPD